MDDEPENLLTALNECSFGHLVKMKTIPLRRYETAAETVYGADKELCTPMTTAFEEPKKIFLVRVTVDFPGNICKIHSMYICKWVKTYRDKALK